MLKRKPPLWVAMIYGAVILVGFYMIFHAHTVHKYMMALKATPLNQSQGAQDSDKIMVEFIDYRCNHCRIMHPVVKEVLRRNPDVKVVYRHYPIFQDTSLREAQIALAAGMQGKYSEAHDFLMTRGDAPLTEEDVIPTVRRLGLDVEQFENDRRGPEIGNFLVFNVDAMKAIGIMSTPTFVIDDIVFQPYSGDATPEMFEEILEEAYGS